MHYWIGPRISYRYTWHTHTHTRTYHIGTHGTHTYVGAGGVLKEGQRVDAFDIDPSNNKWLEAHIKGAVFAEAVQHCSEDAMLTTNTLNVTLQEICVRDHFILRDILCLPAAACCRP